MEKTEKINFFTPYKNEFMAKAELQKGSMTAVLNDWIEAYLQDNLFTRQDMELILSSILMKLGMADRVTEVNDLIGEAIKKPYEKLALSHSALVGKLKLTPGQLLRRIRKENRMTLRDAADAVSERLGKPYTAQSIARLEVQAGTPRRKTIEPVLKAYGYSYEEFMDRLNKS